MDVTGKTAIVTGGGKGIGRGIATVLARYGADVAIADIDLASARKVAEEITNHGRKSLATRLDVSDRKAVEAYVAEVVEQFGKIDILVNNAGVVATRGWEQRQELTDDDWDLVYAVNVKGLAWMTESVATHMKARQYGKIINIASVAGRQGSTFNPAYSASKAGVINYTQSMSVQLAPFSININTICPGQVWTSMAERTSENQRIATGGATTPLRQVFEGNVKKWVPMGREQAPEDIGYLAAFLASDYSSNITGQAINIDGGVRLN